MKLMCSGSSFQFNFRNFSFFITFLAFFLLASLVLFPAQQGHCAQVTLTWDPNSEPDLAGYEIYYGTASRNYQWKIDVGNVTTYIVNGLNTGVTYYFAATAYNTSGLDSGYSNEVVYTGSSCTYALSPASASFSASGGSGSVLVTTQTGCSWGASSPPSWVTITSGSGTGTGTMRYTVSSNTGTARSASMTVGGKVFTIQEAGLSSYTYTITASAGTGGAISPTGQVSVRQGANQTFTITPSAGYQIAGVTVDGVSRGSITTYTFASVTANHTIAASFTPIPRTVIKKPVVSTGLATSVTSISATLNGTVNPNGLSTTYVFQWGSTTSYGITTAVTSAGSGSSNVAVSARISGLSSGRVYHYRLVATNSAGSTYGADKSFTAKPAYTITSSAGRGGSISPAGGVTVQSGASLSFRITPNSGYRIAAVAVDGVSRGAVTSYTFSAVTANHTIVASFIPI